MSVKAAMKLKVTSTLWPPLSGDSPFLLSHFMCLWPFKVSFKNHLKYAFKKADAE